MTTNDGQSARSARLKIGDLVEVKSREEILATLDERGEIDSLPFMPEMLSFCGQRFSVHRLALKLCDTVNSSGFHRMDRAVHLAHVGRRDLTDFLRCDGRAHGGCQAACALYWKESWLRRVDDRENADFAAASTTMTPPAAASARRPSTITATASATCTEDTLRARVQLDGDVDGRAEERWSCQATELPRAAPVHIPWWDARQYARDVQSGNARTFAMLRSVSIMLFNKFQTANRRFLPRYPLIHGAQRYPFIAGALSTTPKASVGIKPGDRVRVKSREEIIATLDARSRNRGLSFDAEMLKYCGREALVRARVERIIDEKTGEMMHLGNPGLILDGVVCTADYNQYCPRGIFPFWREIWLERVG